MTVKNTKAVMTFTNVKGQPETINIIGKDVNEVNLIAFDIAWEKCAVNVKVHLHE